MRARWHKWWLVALASTACSLNPQPDLPMGARVSGGTSSGAGGSSAVVVGPGGPQTGTGNSSSVNIGTGGAAGAAPDAGPPDSVGANDAGEAGAGESGTAGAAGDASVVVGQQPSAR
jgi:hypothetical protein